MKPTCRAHAAPPRRAALSGRVLSRHGAPIAAASNGKFPETQMKSTIFQLLMSQRPLLMAMDTPNADAATAKSGHTDFSAVRVLCREFFFNAQMQKR